MTLKPSYARLAGTCEAACRGLQFPIIRHPLGARWGG